MQKGFYLKRLQVLGNGLDTAEISFEKGLNVLQGGSDTGKSHIFQCIDYIFGCSKPPKNIPESRDYNEIRLQINTFEGKEITLSRRFKEDWIYASNCNIEKFDNVSKIKLNAKHDSKKEDNISCFLLKLVGLYGKKVIVNKRNKKREVSFRDISKICLVDEEKIISEKPPIFSGQYTDKTVEEAIFRLILTNKDDDDLETFEDPKVFQNQVKGRLDLIKEMIISKIKEQTDLSEGLKNLEGEDINNLIEDFTGILNEANRTVLEEEKKRENIWKDAESIRIEIEQLLELENRFGLLNKQYKSDLNRLEFINEGEQYLNQIDNISCPVCGKTIGREMLEKYGEDNIVDIHSSLIAEAKSIQLKQQELSDTLAKIEEEKAQLKDRLTLKLREFEDINKYINNKLKPILELNQKKVGEFFKLKENKAKLAILNEEIVNLNKDKAYYQAKLDEKKQSGSVNVLANEVYERLSSEIKSLLREWGINCDYVSYNKTEEDIEIDGKMRGEFGKGFRAIYHAAFMIGLMKYCLLYNLPHPFFLILDSPMTVYKEGDTAKQDDEVTPDIQDSFFRSLSKYNQESNLQIFIIDNKDPLENVKSNITYRHFTKNSKIGRYGFYPIKKDMPRRE